MKRIKIKLIGLLMLSIFIAGGCQSVESKYLNALKSNDIFDAFQEIDRSYTSIIEEVENLFLSNNEVDVTKVDEDNKESFEIYEELYDEILSKTNELLNNVSITQSLIESSVGVTSNKNVKLIKNDLNQSLNYYVIGLNEVIIFIEIKMMSIDLNEENEMYYEFIANSRINSELTSTDAFNEQINQIIKENTNYFNLVGGKIEENNISEEELKLLVAETLKIVDLLNGIEAFSSEDEKIKEALLKIYSNVNSINSEYLEHYDLFNNDSLLNRLKDNSVKGKVLYEKWKVYE